MRIFLSGMMGTGKSTVARHLGERLGLRVRDLDASIEAQLSETVQTIFMTRGETAFRELEDAMLRQQVAEHDTGVFALGGGTVTNKALRRWLLEQGVVITLHARAEVLAARLAHDTSRPLLSAGTLPETLDRLREQRVAAYSECHLAVDTSDEEPGRIAAWLEGELLVTRVAVPLGERSYCVEIGAGIRTRAATKLRQDAGGRSAGYSSVTVVTDAHVEKLWGEEVASVFRATGRNASEPAHWVTLPPGEEAKHLGTMSLLWDECLQAGMDRKSLLVALGGGVVGDLTGFAAATLLRGIAFAQMPTTLLAMVDSSVGGKTGCDHRLGKNLIGAFHQPRFVQCDTDFLESLPLEEYKAGFAEVIKSAWISGEDAVRLLEHTMSEQNGDLSGWNAEAITRCIRMAVQLKARIVARDEHETLGERVLLNFGHTWGHAIEAQQGYRGMKHGQAVALGMMAAMHLSCALGVATTEDRERLRAMLERVGLPWDVTPYLNTETAAFFASDKKKQAGSVQFVVPGAPGHLGTQNMELDEVLHRTTQGAAS